MFEPFGFLTEELTMLPAGGSDRVFAVPQLDREFNAPASFAYPLASRSRVCFSSVGSSHSVNSFPSQFRRRNLATVPHPDCRVFVDVPSLGDSHGRLRSSSCLLGAYAVWKRGRR